MSTQCRFCGAAIKPNTMFCPACGQIVAADVPAAGSRAVAPPFHTTGPRPASNAVPASPAPVVAPVPLPGVPRWSEAVEPAVPAVPAPAPAAPAAKPGPRRSASSAQAVPASALALDLPDGTVIPIDRTLVIGRNPASKAAAFGGEPVAVADSTRSVSRVHLVVTVDGGIPAAVDAGSGNGTVLERAGALHPLAASEPLALQAADIIRLGEVRIGVVAAASSPSRGDL